jgi:hypothetical protein
MATGEHLDLAQRFLQGLHHEFKDQRLRNSRIPLSTIMAIIRDALDQDRYFPPGSSLSDLGDGALIERRGRRCFAVHERFETGQLRFSEISTHRHFSLRRASVRFLRHYAPLLRVDGVQIGWWS